MLYFDNAATTLAKPPQVMAATMAAMKEFGGVGRGVHEASLKAGMAVYEAREAIATLLHAPCASQVCFTANATAALNIAIDGLLPASGRALTTAASHNSVLRPLFRNRDQRGCSVRVAPIRPDASLDFETYEALLDEGVDLVVVTHSSNLTGDVYDVERMAQLAHQAGALFVLDAAQTAGSFPIDQQKQGFDVVCFTGHKGLYGPQGTGGLAVAEKVQVKPLLEGGSGTHSFEERHPRYMPECLEAGTLNAHGIAGLAAGVAYVEEVGVEHIASYLTRLASTFEEEALRLPGVRVLGGHGGIDRCGVVALELQDHDSAELADMLARRFEVCTRAGAHCAPLMHRALGTEGSGAVRFSFSSFTTEEEIQQGIEALHSVVDELSAGSVTKPRPQ